MAWTGNILTAVSEHVRVKFCTDMSEDLLNVLTEP